MSSRPTPHDYELLGVTPQVGAAGLKKAFRQKVKMWHPDRFQQKSLEERTIAEERFKAVHEAYQRIQADLEEWKSAARTGQAKSRAGSAQPSPKHQPERPETDRGRESSVHAGLRRLRQSWRHQAIMAWQRVRTRAGWTGEQKKLLLLCVLIGMFLYVNRDFLPDLSGPAPDPSGHHVIEETEVAREPFSGAVSSEAFEDEKLEPWDPGPADVPGSGERESNKEFFTLGSSEQEVLQVQGAPTSVKGRIWLYGLSEVFFKEGRVERYNNFDGNLKIRLMPARKDMEAEASFFTLGSSRDEVLAVQGTPTRVSGNRWQYGFSEVRFKEDRVESYDNFFGDLRIRLLPSAGFKGAKGPRTFSINSTRDEVLAVQGTPSSIQGNMWFYGLASVQFREDRVQAVFDPTGTLRFDGGEEKRSASQ